MIIMGSLSQSVLLWLLVLFLVFLLFSCFVFIIILYGKKYEKLSTTDTWKTTRFLESSYRNTNNICCSIMLGNDSVNVISKTGVTEENSSVNLIYHGQNVIITPKSLHKETIKGICSSLVEIRWEKPLDNILLCFKAKEFFSPQELQIYDDLPNVLREISLNTGLKIPCYVILTNCQEIDELNFLSQLENKNQIIGGENFFKNINEGIIRFQASNMLFTPACMNAISFFYQIQVVAERKITKLFHSTEYFCRGIFLSSDSGFQNTIFSQDFCSDLINNLLFIERFLTEKITDIPLPWGKKVKKWIMQSFCVLSSGILMMQTVSCWETYNFLYTILDEHNDSVAKKHGFNKLSDYIKANASKIGSYRIKNLIIPQYFYDGLIHKIQNELYKLYISSIVSETQKEITAQLQELEKYSKENDPVDFLEHLVKVEKEIREYNQVDQASFFNELYEKIVKLDTHNLMVKSRDNIPVFHIEPWKTKILDILKKNCINWANSILPKEIIIQGKQVITDLQSLNDHNPTTAMVANTLTSLKMFISSMEKPEMHWVNSQEFFIDNEYFAKLCQLLGQQQTIESAQIFCSLSQVLFDFKKSLWELHSNVLGENLINIGNNITPSEKLVLLSRGLEIIVNKFPLENPRSFPSSFPQNKAILWKENGLKKASTTLENMKQFIGTVSDNSADLLRKLVISNSILPQLVKSFESYETVPLNIINLEKIHGSLIKNIIVIKNILEMLENVPETEDVSDKIKELVSHQISSFIQLLYNYITQEFLYGNFHGIEKWDGKSNLLQQAMHFSTLQEATTTLASQFDGLSRLTHTIITPFLATMNELDAEMKSLLFHELSLIQQIERDVILKEKKENNSITDLENFILKLDDWNITSILTYKPLEISLSNNLFSNYLSQASNLLCSVSEKYLQQATQQELEALQFFFQKNLSNKFPFNKKSLEDANKQDIQWFLQRLSKNYSWVAQSIKRSPMKFSNMTSFFVRALKIKNIFHNNADLSINGSLTITKNFNGKNSMYVTGWNFNIGDTTIKYENQKSSKFNWKSGQEVLCKIFIADNAGIEIAGNSKNFSSSFQGPWALLRFYYAYRKDDTGELVITIPIINQGQQDMVVMQFQMTGLSEFENL